AWWEPPDVPASGGNAINNAGEVTGFSYKPIWVLHAFLYSGGNMIELGTLGGTNSQGFAINNNGQVTGYTEISDGTQQAFLYSNGQLYDLNNLIPGDSGWVLYWANGINDSGQITGYGVRNGEGHAFLASPATQSVSVQ